MIGDDEGYLIVLLLKFDEECLILYEMIGEELLLVLHNFCNKSDEW